MEDNASIAPFLPQPQSPHVPTPLHSAPEPSSTHTPDQLSATSAAMDKASRFIKQEIMDIELDGISDGSHMRSPLVHPQMFIDGFEFTGGFSTDIR